MSVMMRRVASAAVMSVALGLSAMAASAATITFDGTNPPGGPSAGYAEDGLSFNYARIVNGNCDSFSSKPCLALNDNEVSTLTQVGGGTFTMTSFWFQLLGRGSGGKNPITNTLYVLTNAGTLLSYAANVWGFNNGGQVIDLSANSAFQNVTWVKFYTSNGGNVRIDDIGIADPAPVPLPAAGLTLIAGLGALGALRRRKRAA